MNFNNEYEYFDAIQEANQEKPVVHYLKIMAMGDPVVGQRYNVVTLDHPASYLNEAPYVHTSTVVSVDEATGNFQTLNTNYVLVTE